MDNRPPTSGSRGNVSHYNAVSFPTFLTKLLRSMATVTPFSLSFLLFIMRMFTTMSSALRKNLVWKLPPKLVTQSMHIARDFGCFHGSFPHNVKELLQSRELLVYKPLKSCESLGCLKAQSLVTFVLNNLCQFLQFVQALLTKQSD